MEESINGKTCSQCGQWKPYSEYHRNRSQKDGYQRICKPCMIATNALSRAKNADYWREHYSKRMRDSYAEAREERLAKSKAWYDANGQKYHHQWKDENREAVRAATRKWRAAHPTASQVSGNNTRAKRDGAEGVIAIAEWEALCQQHNHCCASCGEQKKLEIEHIVPIALGGKNSIENIQPLCHKCNVRKKQQKTDYRSR